MLIEKAVLITGSFNFTKAAGEKNAENLLVIRSKDTAKTYIEYWERHKEHSENTRGSNNLGDVDTWCATDDVQLPTCAYL